MQLGKPSLTPVLVQAKKMGYGQWGAESEAADSESSDEPLRCSNAHWALKMGNVQGNSIVPVYVSSRGTLRGNPLSVKTWKLMYDPKSTGYIVPQELKP